MSETPRREIPNLDPREAIELLTAFDRRFDEHVKPLREEFEQIVGRLVGKRIWSFRESVRVAKWLQFEANRLGVLFVCQKSGCGGPAELACVQRDGAPRWKFTHRDGRGRFHGEYRAIPPLVLVRPPMDAAYWDETPDEVQP
jgi:hypothetical protein